MSFDRSLFQSSYPYLHLPQLRCSRCERGRVIFDKAPISELQPQYSKDERDNQDWDPDWIVHRVAFRGKCNIDDCGEVYHAIGTAQLSNFINLKDEWEYDFEFYPEAICPAPSIIEMPENCPKEIKEDLETSFILFWGDYAACATRLRLSVERLLDILGIPREKMSKKGKLSPMNLSQRIDEFSKIDPDHAETINALRFVGNVGAHEGRHKLNTVLDCYEIYEDALHELVGKKSIRLKEIKKKLISSEGKPKS